MVTLPARCELAQWKPVPNFGYDPPRILNALAFVVHSAEGNGDPPPRFYDGSSASAHFWNKKDGTLYQLVELTECAWANGQLNRPDSGKNSTPIVQAWYLSHTNPNWNTVSMEHEGFAGEALTVAQLRNTENVAQWLQAHGLKITAQNLLDHCDISATACPSDRIPHGAVLAALAPAAPPPEDEMTEDQVRAIVADETAKQVTALFNAGAPPHFRDYVNTAINGTADGKGEFSDADGNPLPLVEDKTLVARVEGLDTRLAVLEHAEPGGVAQHTHTPGGVA